MTTLGQQNSARAVSGNAVHSAQRAGNTKATGSASNTRLPGKFDAQAAREFLEMLTPRGTFTFQTFGESEIQTGQQLVQVLHGELRTHGRSLASLNRHGAGVFVAVNETDGRGRKHENITGARALFVDFDTPDPGRPDWLFAFNGFEPSAIVETSPGKHHVYWAVEDISLEEWDALQRGLLAAFSDDGADQGVKDRARVMRVPGFWHQKGERFLTKLLSCSGKRYRADALNGWVEYLGGRGESASPVASPKAGQIAQIGPATQVRGVTLKVAEDALNALPPQHVNDYSRWVRVGMAVHQQFQGSGEAWELWDRWSQGSEKYDNESATRAKWQTFDATKNRGVSMRSVLQDAEANGWQRPFGVEGGSAAAHEFPELSPLDDQPARPATRRRLLRPVGELLRYPPQLNWLVTGIMEHPTIGQIFGDPSSGKSFVALDIAASIATGICWHGHAVSQGAVVYIAGEGYAGALRRLKAWEIDREIPLEGVPLHVSDRAVEFSSPETVEHLRVELDELERPVLIVIDTLARATTGWDENSNKDMGVFMSAIDKLARRYGCSVLLVHHSGHGNSARGRGASSINAAMDMSMRLENNHGVRRLDCTKMKESEEFPSEYFELRPVTLPPDWLDSDGERIVSAVLIDSSRGAQAVPERPQGSNQVAVYEVALEMGRERWSDDPSPLLVSNWKRRCTALGIERNRFAEAQAGLVKRGLITMEGAAFKIAPPLFPDEPPGETIQES